jgi:hypothetical protein
MIRPLEPSDIPTLARIHTAAGYTYPLPDITAPLFLNRIVSVTANGIVTAAGLHRICYETFVLVDPSQRPQEKWAALRELNAELSTRAYKQGLDMTHASVPPIGFDRRLRQLGWQPDLEGYRLWSRQTNAVSSQPGE